jgi:uncharacterized membrane protein YfcA
MTKEKVSKRAVLLWAVGVLFLVPGAYLGFLGNQQSDFLKRSAGIVLILMSVALARAAVQESRQIRNKEQQERLRRSEL